MLAEAKSMVLALMARDIDRANVDVAIDPHSPDPSDPAKLSIDGRPARVIHHFSGWHIPIHLGWFAGGFDRPTINRDPFHWYVFAIPRLKARREDHYLVCDFLQVRQWVLEFRGQKGNDHRDHKTWMAQLRVREPFGPNYFRWGDEPIDFVEIPTRAFILDNIATLPGLRLLPRLTVGSHGGTGESEAHRLLKIHVARNPQILSLSSHAESEMEHSFRTGDRVDVFFRNHDPDRSVVEVEVEGRENLITGLHQAIKYRALAEAADNFPTQSPRVRAYLVAYDTNYDEVREGAALYQVRLLTVDRRDVLLGTA